MLPKSNSYVYILYEQSATITFLHYYNISLLYFIHFLSACKMCQTDF